MGFYVNREEATYRNRLLDRMVYFLTLCYATVSCSELNTIPATFVSAALILGLIRHILSPVKLQIEPSIQYAVATYWLALALSTVAAYPDVRFSQAWSFIDRMLTLPLVLMFCRTQRQLIILTGCIVFSLFVADIVGFWQIGQNLMLRISSVFGNPIHFGEHLLLVSSFVLPLAVLSVPGAPRYFKTILQLVLLLSIIAAAFNQTRAAWIAATFVWLTLAMLTRRKNRRFLLCSLLVLLGIAIGFIYSPGLQSRLVSITSNTSQSNYERIQIWKATFVMISDNPVLGVGPDNFGEQYQKRYILPTARERQQRDAHNTYLSVTAELGLVGLVAFLHMMGQFLMAFARRARESAVPAWPLAGLLVVLGFCIYGTMNSLINSFWAVRLFWLLIGISLAADNLSRQSLQNKPPA